jgi:putative transposase
VSRSGYYRTKKKTEGYKKSLEDAVINCFQKHNENYGRPRIYHELKGTEYECSQYIIRNILIDHGLKAKGGRRRKRKQPKPPAEVYLAENLVQDKMAVTTPNYLLCADISESKYKYGKLYISGIIDVATRRIVGVAIAKNACQEIVHDAIKMAAGLNILPEGAIFHSDRGCQYTSKKTKELVEKLGMRKSMSRPGTPSDNQPIESFWKTLKLEILDLTIMTFEEAKTTIFRYIMIYYNSERIHSGIDYRTPNDQYKYLISKQDF